MKIEILGMGCQKCNTLMENAKQATKELNISAEFAKVDDMKIILGYGVMTTPALVIDGVVKFSGKVASKEEIKGVLK